MPATLSRADKRAAKLAAFHANRRRELEQAESFPLDELPAMPVNDPLEDGNKIAAVFEEIRQKKAAEKSPDGEFPLHALPAALRTWIEAMTLQTHTAPETAATLALAVSAAALARNVSVQPVSGWQEPLNLYVGVLSTQGDQCDTVMAAALAPLRDCEQEEQADHLREVAADRIFRQDSRRDFRRQLRVAEERHDVEELERIDQARIEVEAMEAKPQPRRIVNEVCARAIHYHLAEVGRIACFSQRGEVFHQLAGRNTVSRERLVAVLEECHAGTDLTSPLTRGKSKSVAAPSVTVASLIDRSLVSAIAAQRDCPARELLSSFVYVQPPNRPTSLKVHSPMPPDISAAYAEGIRRLAARRAGKLTLEADARLRCYEWGNEVDSLVDSGPLAPIQRWAKKLPGLTLRIAGILHAWQEDGSVISLDTFAAAIEIARYLAPQAISALAQLGAADDDCLDLERAVLHFARSAEEFSPREAMDHLRRTITRRSTLRRTLRALVERGHLLIAKEGKRFPTRFSLANRTVVARWNEFTESTPGEVGVPPDGGEQAIKVAS